MIWASCLLLRRATVLAHSPQSQRTYSILRLFETVRDKDVFARKDRRPGSAGYLLSTRLLVTDLSSPGFVRCIVSIYGQMLDAQLEQLRGTGCPRAAEAEPIFSNFATLKREVGMAPR